ncbi:SHOCT domain-containing protein [Fontibacillus sp. BL9]|uniref:SHOCT domain-containing protein n=1 Tax=Fontibacillus sp. BL9 TaxID=3389971 RepID=UPI00397B357B
MDIQCSIVVCSKKALENGYCEDHQAFAPENADILEGGKHLKLLLEKVRRDDIIEFAKGVNGLVAVTSSNVYIVRGTTIERKIIKSYSIKSISSIELKKPGLMMNGHLQVITSGNNDRTNRFNTAFDYAKDENTVMISKLSGDYDKFVSIENLIYKLRDNLNTRPAAASSKTNDIFEQIKKLGELRDLKLITEEDYEIKKIELLSKI